MTSTPKPDLDFQSLLQNPLELRRVLRHQIRLLQSLSDQLKDPSGREMSIEPRAQANLRDVVKTLKFFQVNATQLAPNVHGVPAAPADSAGAENLRLTRKF